MPVEPGQTLLHYRIVDKLGEGGMGVVWSAEDTKLHRRVALKVLPQAMAAEPERRSRFEREARAVAALNHPNIVTLHSVEQAETPDGKLHFITMELVEGRTLTQLLPRNGFPLHRLLEIAIPLADAVCRAHREGILHRDLKPDNIMIDGDGRLRVLDFGLAKLQGSGADPGNTQLATVTSDTAEGRVLGTVAYMSPEQAEGKEVDARSDVFSLGTILYQMATGRRPFRGDTTMSTISAILKDDPSEITDIKPALPRHVGRIVRRCLAKDPDLRYQTALDVRNELTELKRELDTGVHAGASAAAGPTGRPRWPFVVAAAAVLGVALVASLMSQSRDDALPSLYTPRPISATNAWESGPNWSPDGKFVAFERISAGEMSLHVKPVDGGTAVARVELPGEQINPRWTPDGNHLVYLSRHESGTALYLTPADGGEPRKLADMQIHTLDFLDFMGDRPWSIDGESLLISLPTSDGRMAIHRVSRATGETKQVTFPPPGSRDGVATHSFDGERVLFRRASNGRGTLMTMPAAGGEASVLFQDDDDVGSGAWRPDGRRVVFISWRGSSVGNLFEFDIATKKIRRLTNLTLQINHVSVSVDDRIVVALFRHDQFFFIVDAETGERRQITDHVKNNWTPKPSPDGRTVAYTSDRTGNAEIWIHTLDGGAERRFTDDPATDLSQDWSPDGRRLLFLSDRGGKGFRLYVANADGGTGVRLLVDQSTHFGQGSTVVFNNPVARWSPDGETIAYRVMGEAGPELWTVRADGTGARKRFDGATGFSWYLDGRRALLTRSTGIEEELLAVDLESGEERSLFTGPLQEIDVARDGTKVAFCYGGGHMSLGLATLQLERLRDPAGLPQAVGEPEYVVPTEGTFHVHSGMWVPDGQRLVYVEDTDYGDLYELVGSGAGAR